MNFLGLFWKLFGGTSLLLIVGYEVYYNFYIWPKPWSQDLHDPLILASIRVPIAHEGFALGFWEIPHLDVHDKLGHDIQDSVHLIKTLNSSLRYFAHTNLHVIMG